MSAKSLHDIEIRIHGRDYEQPSASSVVGRYLSETGAASGLRQFQERPGSDALGVPRFVISVSNKTYPRYLQLFGGKNILEQLSTRSNHTYNHLRWRNEIFLGEHLTERVPGEGTLGIPILISDSEAYRLQALFYLFSQYPRSTRQLGSYSGYQFPFHIKGYGFPNVSYYNNCGSWPALLMIGDTLVDSLRLPGNLDRVPPTRPRVGRLTDYAVPDNIQPRDHDLFKRTFSVPGHQPLWEMLGFRLDEGDWTASGWSSHTLLGRAGVDRVPILVYYTDNHRKPLPRQIDPRIYLFGWPNPQGTNGFH
jgi:hypothetical protein